MLIEVDRRFLRHHGAKTEDAIASSVWQLQLFRCSTLALFSTHGPSPAVATRASRATCAQPGPAQDLGGAATNDVLPPRAYHCVSRKTLAEPDATHAAL